MIKLVKFNLLIDGQRCRTIEDLRNNFNLLDVMEEFQNGKLEKWLKVRNFDEYEAVRTIEKNITEDKIAECLYEIFKIDLDKKIDLNEAKEKAWEEKMLEARKYMDNTIFYGQDKQGKHAKFEIRKPWFGGIL